jgi:hypothetical protein
LELAVVHVVRVDFYEGLPFFGEILEGKNGRDRADGDAGAAIDADGGIDIELSYLVEGRAAVIVGAAFCGVDAIYRADVHARGVFRADAGFCDYECHWLTPSKSVFAVLLYADFVAGAGEVLFFAVGVPEFTVVWLAR